MGVIVNISSTEYEKRHWVQHQCRDYIVLSKAFCPRTFKAVPYQVMLSDQDAVQFVSKYPDDMTFKFQAHGAGVTPRFNTQYFNAQFREWQAMQTWCLAQGWVQNQDFLANSEFSGCWYFRTPDQQMLFALRWA